MHTYHLAVKQVDRGQQSAALLPLLLNPTGGMYSRLAKFSFRQRFAMYHCTFSSHFIVTEMKLKKWENL